MAAIPSGGSLVATHDYYRRRIGSTSSNSSCGSSEYSGEVIPHPPGLPKQDSGHWWSSFFFGKQIQTVVPNGSDTQHKTGTYTLANGQVTCVAQNMVVKRKLSDSSDSGKQEITTNPPAS
ncbi:pancreatic progenitor cell differentiation and proliferation factor A [Brachyhypopomus gauderio]|uniref:pancreatic progenitor cell differentiation and proliferation factor A n=1 Tax=Brachyhypopomus gauderio TaxID=698409 RepID=UPI0040422A1C